MPVVRENPVVCVCVCARKELLGKTLSCSYVAFLPKDCSNFGFYISNNGSDFSANVNKTCAMLKASWALAIIAIIAFFVTFVSRKTASTLEQLLTNFRSFSLF